MIAPSKKYSRRKKRVVWIILSMIEPQSKKATEGHQLSHLTVMVEKLAAEV